MHSNVTDITDCVFGRLTVIKYAGTIDRKALWLCKCACGNSKTIRMSDMMSGKISSCGCLRRDKNRLTQLGSNNSNWKGGTTSGDDLIRGTYIYKVWRDSVLRKNDYTCVACLSNLNLIAHHLIPVNKNPEMAYNLDNGITLCRSCHTKLHHTLGEGYM